MAPEDLFHGVAHFAHGGAGTDGLHGGGQQVALPRLRYFCDSCQRLLHLGCIAFLLDVLEAGDLRFAHLDVVHFQDLDRVFLGKPVLVDAHDHVLAGIDARLLLGRGRLDLELGPAAVHRLGHAAHGVDLLDDGPGGVGHILGELFHHVAAGPWVDHAGDVRLFLDDELRVARDAGGELGGQRNGFVEAVGVQALRAAEDGRHGLDGGAHHVVVRVLLGQAPAAGLAVRAQHQALGVPGVEALHDAAPQQAGGAHLGDLQIEVHAHGPEERQAAGKGIHVHALGQGGLHVFLAVGQGEGHFQRLVGAGFLHVVAADADRVELRHVLGRVLDDVADDLHRRLGRVDVGVADHELLEDVVLDGPGQLVLAHALLLGRHDVAGQDGQHRAIHGHGDAHLVQRDAVEQDLHVLHAVDGHAGLAHVAGHARVVGVVAAVRGQVERHAHALPAGGQRLAVEGVGFLRGGKARVLPDGPRAHRVHGGLRAAQEGLEARQRVGVRQARHVFSRVQGLDGDAVGGDPVERIHLATGRGFLRGLLPVGQGGGLEFGLVGAHGGALGGRVGARGAKGYRDHLRRAADARRMRIPERTASPPGDEGDAAQPPS